jgi:hypothetical protein
VSTIDFISQNHPNPAVNNTEITVHLMYSANISVQLHNMLGQKVLEIDQGTRTPGLHTINIDVSRLDDGIYFYTVNAGAESVTKKMIVR